MRQLHRVADDVWYRYLYIQRSPLVFLHAWINRHSVNVMRLPGVHRGWIKCAFYHSRNGREWKVLDTTLGKMGLKVIYRYSIRNRRNYPFYHIYQRTASLCQLQEPPRAQAIHDIKRTWWLTTSSGLDLADLCVRANCKPTNPPPWSIPSHEYFVSQRVESSPLVGAPTPPLTRRSIVVEWR
jgi:hypothetical protein